MHTCIIQLHNYNNKKKILLANNSIIIQLKHTYVIITLLINTLSLVIFLSEDTYCA